MIEWGVLGTASGNRGTIKPMGSESAARWAAHRVLVTWYLLSESERSTPRGTG